MFKPYGRRSADHVLTGMAVILRLQVDGQHLQVCAVEAPPYVMQQLVTETGLHGIILWTVESFV